MQITAVAAGAAPVVGCLGPGNPWRFLSEHEARTLEAICERIIPVDRDAGAAWAGVVNFVDKQLMGPYRGWRQAYRLGLAAVNDTSQKLFGKQFTEITPSQQDEILHRWEKGEAPANRQAFFQTVVSHTMQGFYGDPRHGGNRDRVSWKMLRLPYPPVRGRLQS